MHKPFNSFDELKNGLEIWILVLKLWKIGLKGLKAEQCWRGIQPEAMEAWRDNQLTWLSLFYIEQQNHVQEVLLATC